MKSFTEFLLKVPMFKGLDHGVLSEVDLVAKPIQAAAGDYLFRQGQASDGMYLIERGRIAIEVRTPGDQVLQVAEVSHCEVLGEMALMDDGVRSASARVIEDTTGYYFSRQRYDMLKTDLRPAGIALSSRLTKGVGNSCGALMDGITGQNRAASEIRMNLDLIEKYKISDAWPCDHSVLRQFAAFAEFRDEEITTLIDSLDRIKIPAGVTLFSMGDPPDGMYIVLRGALRLGISSPQSNVQFNIHGPGSMAGYIEVFEGRNRAADLVSRETAELAYLPAAQFSEMIRQQSPLVFKLLANLGRQSVSQLRKINNVVSRIASFDRCVL